MDARGPSKGDRELELYVQAGLPPMAAIRTATLKATPRRSKATCSPTSAT